MKAVRELLFIVDVAGKVQEENPVTEVVQLVQGRTAKVHVNGKAEMLLYDQFARWCGEKKHGTQNRYNRRG